MQCCLMIKVLFKLPFRQTTGMVANLLTMAGLDRAVPGHRTLCRREKALAVQILNLRADGPDCGQHRDRVPSAMEPFRAMARQSPAGLQLAGQKAWRSGSPPVGTVHLVMDTATSDIRAVAFTPRGNGEWPILPVLLDQVPDGEEIGSVTADGA
jgi:hypothetical protein